MRSQTALLWSIIGRVMTELEDQAVARPSTREVLEQTLEEIGEHFREARERSQRDQRSVEQAVGVSKGFLSKIENARDTLPSVKTAMALCREVGADWDFIRPRLVRAQFLRRYQFDDEIGWPEILHAVFMMATNLLLEPIRLLPPDQELRERMVRYHGLLKAHPQLLEPGLVAALLAKAGVEEDTLTLLVEEFERDRDEIQYVLDAPTEAPSGGAGDDDQ